MISEVAFQKNSPVRQQLPAPCSRVAAGFCSIFMKALAGGDGHCVAGGADVHWEAFHGFVGTRVLCPLYKSPPPPPHHCRGKKKRDLQNGAGWRQEPSEALGGPSGAVPVLPVALVATPAPLWDQAVPSLAAPSTAAVPWLLEISCSAPLWPFVFKWSLQWEG